VNDITRQYGASFADVYDDWYPEPSPSSTAQTVATLAALAGDGAVLELGVGTGRLALPLAARGLNVAGIDSSPEMLQLLAAKHPPTELTMLQGDMARDLPAGPFSLVYIAFNTFFNLVDEADQIECFRSVRNAMAPDGVFAIEVFVPDDQDDPGAPLSVVVKETPPGRTVLMATSTDGQRVYGQHIEIVPDQPVRFRPWTLRWATIAQLDDMARSVGLVPRHRWASWDTSRFDDSSTTHVTVYAAPTKAQPTDRG
jgi:SAM-dependent methyltransferase